MLMISQEEWQSLHEKLDYLTDLIEKARGSNLANEWLESEEARHILRVSPKTWQNYRDQRLIPFSQISREIYVNRADLDTFLRNHHVGR